MTENEPFDLENFLPYLLNQAAEESSLRFQREYRDRYGMLRTEWRVLFHLGRYGRMTASEIGARSRMHKTKISRAVQKLSERRFLSRERDEVDRRQEYLALTAQGQTAYDELQTVARQYDSQLTAQFTKAEMLALRKGLRKLAGMS